jgi:two-component system invasion response regulator UvrY
MIKILITDDHSIVRQGLKQIIDQEPDMKVSAEASNVHEMMEKVRKQNWDLVILDLTLPGKTGLDALKEIKLERAKLPVLILSMHPEDQYAVRVLKAGASGYMTKETAPEELIQAIRKIVGGGKYVSVSLAEKLAFDLGAPTEKDLHELLSDREYQVLCLIASGKAVNEISKQLALSVKTISTYRARILEKMNLKNNAELMHYAMQNKLV